MSTQTFPPTSDAVRWARQSLQIDDVGSAPSTAELLRRVTESEYLLSPETADAVQLLADPDGLAPGSHIASLATQRGREQRLAAAVADCANEFFDLACDERRRRWKTLVDECANEPASAVRLNRLELGLDVEPPPLTDSANGNHLIQTCRDAFLARPLTAARLRRELCEMWRADVSTWEDVTDDALERHPQFFKAVAPWVDEFGDRRWRESLQEAKPAPAREPWAVPQEPIPPSPWIGYSEKVLNYTSLVLAVVFFGLVLAIAPFRRDYKPPVPQRDPGRFPSYEESRRLAPLFDRLREAERKRADQKHQDSADEPRKSVRDDSAR